LADGLVASYSGGIMGTCMGDMDRAGGAGAGVGIGAEVVVEVLPVFV